jgi:hypothetical protein
MNDGDRFDIKHNLAHIEQTLGVRDLWSLPQYVKQLPPMFSFDYDTAYTILTILANAAVERPLPVLVNMAGLGELYQIDAKNVEAYFHWLCKVGILKAYVLR